MIISEVTSYISVHLHTSPKALHNRLPRGDHAQVRLGRGRRSLLPHAAHQVRPGSGGSWTRARFERDAERVELLGLPDCERDVQLKSVLLVLPGQAEGVPRGTRARDEAINAVAAGERTLSLCMRVCVCVCVRARALQSCHVRVAMTFITLYSNNLCMTLLRAAPAGPACTACLKRTAPFSWVTTPATAQPTSCPTSSPGLATSTCSTSTTLWEPDSVTLTMRTAFQGLTKRSDFKHTHTLFKSLAEESQRVKNPPNLPPKECANSEMKLHFQHQSSLEDQQNRGQVLNALVL